MMLAQHEMLATGNVLTFTRRPRLPLPESRWLKSARHIIICVDDAFPVGTVRRLQEARPKDCFAVIDSALDVGQGSRYLSVPFVRDRLRREFDRSTSWDCEIIAWCIEPTHAHVLIRETDGFSPEATVERWKATALDALSDCRSSAGFVWAPGYYDTTLHQTHAIEGVRHAIEAHD